jgi:hypothetical protein
MPWMREHMVAAVTAAMNGPCIRGDEPRDQRRLVVGGQVNGSDPLPAAIGSWVPSGSFPDGDLCCWQPLASVT